MKTEITDISPTRKEIKIEIEAEAVKKVYQKMCVKYSKLVSVPGFRKGFAPMDVVKMRYSEEIQNETLRELLPEKVTQAVQESGLEVIGEPELHLENQGTMKVNGTQPISLHVHVEVYPEITNIDYKGLEATRRVRPVEETEIEEVISERLTHSSALVPVEDRKSQSGDTLIVDLVGVFVGEDAQPIAAEDLEIKLGESYVEATFNENLTGVEQDDVKTFSVEYPVDYSTPALAGKTVNYTATVKSVGVVEIPEADDAWAQGLGEEFESMKDLRSKLRDDMELMAKLEADNRAKDELITQLINKNNVEVPSRLVENQARNLLNNFAQDMMNRGIDPKQINEDFVKMAMQSFSVQAEKDVLGALLLEKIAEVEKVEISKEEIDEEISKMAVYYKTTVDDIRKSLEKSGGEFSVSERLRSRKAVDVIYDNAKITDGEWLDEAQLAALANPDATDEKKPKKLKAKAKVEAEVAEEKPKSKAKTKKTE
jgi:trigger factor